MTQEQDNSEQQIKPARKRSTRTAARRAAPKGDVETPAAPDAAATPEIGTAPKKPRRRTVKAAPDAAAPSDGAPTSPVSAEAEPPASGTRVRRTRVSRAKAETPGEESSAPVGAVASGETAVSASEESATGTAEAAAAPKKPRRRTTKAAKADAAPADDNERSVSEVPAAPVVEAKPVRTRRSRKKAESDPEAEAAAAAAAVALLPVFVERNEAEAETVETARPQEVPAPDAAKAPEPRPVYEDDGVVTHILPLPTELDERDRRRRPRRRSKRAIGGLPGDDGGGMAPDISLYDIVQPPLPGSEDPDPLRSKRHRSRRKRKPGGVQPFQPETFADVYPSSVLGAGDHFVFADDADEFEDDGPQPALPGQPSLALPPASLEEEDLEALDEAVNGNRIDLPEPGKKRGRKGGRAEAARPGKSTRPAPVAVAKQERPDEDDSPEVPAGKRVLYMSVVPEEQVEVVITDNGQVTEYFVEMAHQAKIRGNIYKGVINNVDTNLQAAFVNFGGGKNGFLQIDEVHPEYWLAHHDSSKGPKYPPIQKVLKVGQEVLVQVVKEPAGSKGAFLTTWVSLAGRFLVLTPGQEQIGVSRKVEDPEERTRLKELLAGIDPGEDMGVIIRTASEGASKTSIQKDLQFLKRLWKDIRKRATTEKSPSLIYQEADLASRALRDYLAEDIREIWVDDETTLESIRETTGLLFPRRQDMVKLHRDPRQTLWERFNLQRQLEEVASREVILPSGGRLVFDQTEALMAIDINSGKTQGKSNFEAMVFRTNMEAAEAIARHLRLRDIGGQVVIDFIEMRDRNHCRDVEKALRNAMRLDRARHDVGHMSSFGLLELVRQRTGTSAISISSEPCPYCRGTGVRRNMEWQALHALRELQSKLVKSLPSDSGKSRKGDYAAKNGHSGTAFVYETEPELGLYLLNKKRDRLVELESRFSVAIEIRLKACAV